MSHALPWGKIPPHTENSGAPLALSRQRAHLFDTGDDDGVMWKLFAPAGNVVVRRVGLSPLGRCSFLEPFWSRRLD